MDLGIGGTYETEDCVYKYMILTHDDTAYIQLTMKFRDNVIELINDEFDSVKRASETFRDSVSLSHAIEILTQEGVDSSHDMFYLGGGYR